MSGTIRQWIADAVAVACLFGGGYMLWMMLYGLGF